MLYSTWINQMRAQTGDYKRRVHVDFTGNGSDLVFQMPEATFPVLDDALTYTVKVNSVTLDEGDDYTLDKMTGTLTLVSTPSNGQAVEIDAITVRLRDSDWLQVTNDVIRSLGLDFWKEFVDTSVVTVANMLSLSLSVAQPSAIAIYELQHRRSATENWRPVSEFTNWRYDMDNNTLYFGLREAFPISGQELRIRGLKKIVTEDEISDTLDLPDRFLTILEYGCLARYYRWRYKDVVELVSKLSTESSRTPLQELIMASDRFDRLYEQEKAKLKPQKPTLIIPPYRDGGGRP